MSIESVIAKKLYPTPENCQRTEDCQHPTAVASMLSQLVSQVPMTERDSLRLTGWSHIKIEWDHTMSATEQQAEKLKQALALVTASGVSGMTPEQVAALRGILLG